MGTVRLGTRQYSAAVLAVNGIFYPVPQFRKTTFAGAGLSGTAIAAGFKLYPAFLGVLLLRDKNYLAAVRTVLYGVVCPVLPAVLLQ